MENLNPNKYIAKDASEQPESSEDESGRDFLVTYTTWAKLNARSKAEQITEPWSEFVKKFSERRKFSGKFLHPGWTGAIFSQPYRKDENVTAIHWLILDIDHNYTIEQARSTFGNYRALLHTSKSHSETEEAFRIAFPLSREVDSEEHEKLWQIAASQCNNLLDPAPKASSQFFFQPGVLEDDSIFYAEEWRGRLLPVDEWLSIEEEHDVSNLMSELNSEPQNQSQSKLDNKDAVTADTARLTQTSESQPKLAPVLKIHKTPPTNGKHVDRFERARKWVEQAEPAISGSGGHNATWLVARKCAGDFELDYQQTLDILLNDYNPRCQPPWSTKDLEHKAREAVEKARVRVPIEDRERYDRHWGSPADNDFDYHNDTPEDDHNQQQTAKSTILTADDIFATPNHIDTLVPGLGIKPGPVVMAVARSGIGKSVILQDAGISSALGRSWWGLFPVQRPLKVLWIDLEQGKQTTLLRFKRLALGHDLTPDDLREKLDVLVSPKIKDEVQFRKLLEGYDLAFIDCFRVLCGHIDENDSRVREPLDMCARASESSGCAITIIHHGRKATENNRGGARDVTRGSSAIQDAVDAVYFFDRDGDEPEGPIDCSCTKVSRATGKAPKPWTLEIKDVDLHNSADVVIYDGGLTVTGTRAAKTDPFEVTRQQRKFKTDKILAELVTLFQKSGTLGGLKAIAARLGHNQTAVGGALALLIEDGRVEITGTTQSRNHVWRGEKAS